MTRAGDGSARPGATTVAVLAVCLAATSLHAVLKTESWYWPSVLAAVVVAGISLAARALRVPVVLQPLLALGGLLLVLTGLYASGPAVAGFLPTAGSLRALGTLSSNGVNSLDALLAPTPATTQLKVLCVAAVGLMALSVDLIAIGGRRPAYAGIPLVLLVAVPSAIRERSVGFASLLAAVLGFLLLLTLDGTDRTSRWGRLLPGPDGGRGPAASGTAGPALRIGAAAIVAALLIPQLIPGAHTSRFSAAGSGNGAGRGGGGTVVVIDPFVSVANELTEQKDQTLLTVGGTVPTYQRITALEDFTEKGFSLGTSVTASAAATGVEGPARAAVRPAVAAGHREDHREQELRPKPAAGCPKTRLRSESPVTGGSPPRRPRCSLRTTRRATRRGTCRRRCRSRPLPNSTRAAASAETRRTPRSCRWTSRSLPACRRCSRRQPWRGRPGRPRRTRPPSTSSGTSPMARSPTTRPSPTTAVRRASPTSWPPAAASASSTPPPWPR